MDKRRGDWTASMNVQKQRYPLGSFATEKEAAAAYDKKALELCGDDARLNFHPDTGEEILGKPFRRNRGARRR